MPQTVFNPIDVIKVQNEKIDHDSFKNTLQQNLFKGLSQEQYGQISALNNIQPHDFHVDAVQTEIEQQKYFQKPNSFNIDKFLQEFFSIGNCLSMDIKNECVKNHIFEDTFDHLSDLQNNIGQFYQNFDEKIYKPLGLKKDPKESIHGIVQELLHSEKEDSYIKEMNFPTNYGIFENIIMSMFRQINDASSDMENNKENVQQNLKKILESFHLYWNTLRGKNEVDRAVKDTRDLVKNILQDYGHREQYLFDLTLTVIQKIKKSYKKFIQAHQSLMMIQNYGPNLISDIIQKRYKSICMGINNKHFNSVSYVKEIKNILDLTKGFIISAAHMQKKKKIAGSIQNSFDGKVIERIKDAYANFDIYKFSDKQNLAVKEFTVIVLLKLKHLYYLMTVHYSINSFVQRPQIDIEQQKKVTVKIYYVLMDMLVLVPETCKLNTSLKQCAIQTMNQTLRNISDKFFLRRSVSGWSIYETIIQIFNDFFIDVDPIIWTSFHDFTTFYYQNLFRVIFNFKQTFNINEDQSLIDLENLFVNVIENFQKEIINVNFNTGLLRQLQNDVYTNFLNLKAQYDEYAPISQDTEIIKQIENFVIDFLKEFEQEYNSKIDDSFYNLLASLRKVLDHWSMVCLSHQKLPLIKVPVPIQNEYYLKKFPDLEPNEMHLISTDQASEYVNQDYLDLKIFKKIQKEMTDNKEQYQDLKDRQNKTKNDVRFKEESTEEEHQKKMQIFENSNKEKKQNDQEDKPTNDKKQEDVSVEAQESQVDNDKKSSSQKDSKQQSVNEDTSNNKKSDESEQVLEDQGNISDQKQELQENISDQKQSLQEEIQDQKQEMKNNMSDQKHTTEDEIDSQNQEIQDEISEQRQSHEEDSQNQKQDQSQDLSHEELSQENEVQDSKQNSQDDVQDSKQENRQTENESQEDSQADQSDIDRSDDQKSQNSGELLKQRKLKSDEESITRYDVLQGNRYDLKDKLEEALQTVPNFSPSEIKTTAQTNDEDSGTLNGFTLDASYGPIMR